jgi:uncharacterized protein YdhG (YjbR/CyaY superfamily)
MAAKFETLDAYLAALPEASVAAVDELRATIRATAPGASEVLSYQIGAFKLDGKILIYYAGWAKHVSLYPVPDATAETADGIEKYRAGKGTLQFPLTEPMPLDFVAAVVRAAIAQRSH